MIRKPSSPGNSLFSRILAMLQILCVTALLFVTGCAVGGSSPAADSSGPVLIEVSPIKISSSGDSDKDGLMATISGSGVTSAWIEDTTGQKIGSNLAFQNVSQRYQALLVRNLGGFTAGQYTLKYTVGADTKEYKSESLSWTVTGFTSAPMLTWNSQSRFLDVTFNVVPGASRYRLEVWNADTGSLWYLYPDADGGYIGAYIQQPGNYHLRLIAGKTENGAFRSQAAFVWEKTY